MSTDRADPQILALERLSALVDGELEPTAVGQACAHWREDAASRSTWHAYQLIGDVLRSDDLASDASRDSAFLASLRVKLAAEPVVLAPQPLPAPPEADEPIVVRVANGAASSVRSSRPSRWSWMAPSAVAAGFVVVAGVMMVSRNGDVPIAAGKSDNVVVATSRSGALPAAQPMTPSLVPASALQPQTLLVDPTMIRDARLDRYLAAHKQFAGSSVLGVPSVFLRNATADASNR